MVSVIIPTYNYANYIIEAIESVLQQEYPPANIEIIVVDDGSTDNTKTILQPLIDSRKIKYTWQANKGKAAATHAAIQQCSGKYIFNLDADDYFLSGKIKNTVEIFEADETIVHVASPALFCSKGLSGSPESLPPEIVGKKITGNDMLLYFYRNNIFYGSGSTFAARASALKTIAIPGAVDMYTDEFLVLALLPKGDSYFITRALSAWRMHERNYSGKATGVEQQKAKDERLLRSSAAVLCYLIENNYDKELIKIYRLKNNNRLISFKESYKTKTVKDILQYAREVFFDIKPGWKLVKKYQVLNRLLPLSVFLFLKKISSGNH